MTLSAEEILAGSQLTFLVEVPDEILTPGGNGAGQSAPHSVRLRPLTVHDLQVISRAAKESENLTATLMVQRSLVEPELSIAQAAGMHVGLMHFLMEQVNRISAITLASDTAANAIEAPLAKAAFVLARKFGWTPQQINELTLGQILLHLQMLKEKTGNSL
jgi:hypothetical protein